MYGSGSSFNKALTVLTVDPFSQAVALGVLGAASNMAE